MRRCLWLLVVVIVAFVLPIFGPCVAAAMDGLPVAVELTNMGSGSRGWVRIADDEGLEPQNLTIEARVTPRGPGYGGTTPAGAGAVVVCKPMEGVTGTAVASFAVKWHPVSEHVAVFVGHELGSLGTQLWSTGTVPVNATAHVAMSFDGVWLRVFINGQLDSEVLALAGPIDYAEQDVLIGAGNFGDSLIRAFQGVIDDVRIWDYARNAGEISAQMGCSLDGDEPGLLAYYSFNESDLRDDSGNGHAGVEDGLVDYVLSNDACLPFLSDMEAGDLSDWTSAVQ